MCEYRNNSIRLRGWDYTNPGVYFVTICTDADICWFGKIRNNNVILSKLGKNANQYWRDIPKHHKNVKLDRYIIMPNHIHGIIIIKGQSIYQIGKIIWEPCRDVACNVPVNNENVSINNDNIRTKNNNVPLNKINVPINNINAPTNSRKIPTTTDIIKNKNSKISPKSGSLSTVIRSYKSAVTRHAHKYRNPDFKWQSRYYDHIIKNEHELIAITKYIIDNPKKWKIKLDVSMMTEIRKSMYAV